VKEYTGCVCVLDVSVVRAMTFRVSAGSTAEIASGIHTQREGSLCDDLRLAALVPQHQLPRVGAAEHDIRVKQRELRRHHLRIALEDVPKGSYLRSQQQGFTSGNE